MSDSKNAKKGGGGDRFGKLSESIGEMEREAREIEKKIDAWTERLGIGRAAVEVVDVEPTPEPMPTPEPAPAPEPPEPTPEPTAQPEPTKAGGGTESATVEAAWFYGEGKERMGPVPDKRLRTLLKRGELGESTLVWTKGQEGWISAAEAGLVVPVAGEEAPPLPADGAAGGAGSEKECPGCGAANRESAKFCASCGDGLVEVKPQEVQKEESCPSCQAVVTVDAKFCRGCGARLS